MNSSNDTGAWFWPETTHVCQDCMNGVWEAADLVQHPLTPILLKSAKLFWVPALSHNNVGGDLFAGD